MILPQNFYHRNTILVAKELLGKVLVCGKRAGMIVETEAYIGTEDKACHARSHKKETCFPLWGPPGFSYVYLTYGLYYMFNISTEKEGFPAAVLIRALEPLTNITFKTDGPGKLTRALEIDKSFNNTDITKQGIIFVTDNIPVKENNIVSTTRVGIDYAEEYRDKPWRFYIKGNSSVSKK